MKGGGGGGGTGLFQEGERGDKGGWGSEIQGCTVVGPKIFSLDKS